VGFTEILDESSVARASKLEQKQAISKTRPPMHPSEVLSSLRRHRFFRIAGIEAGGSGMDMSLLDIPWFSLFSAESVYRPS
jgi:hypothetical protein